jgi:hypothetical protein
MYISASSLQNAAPIGKPRHVAKPSTSYCQKAHIGCRESPQSIRDSNHLIPSLLTMKKKLFFRNSRIEHAYIFDLQIFRIFSSLSFFLWSPVAAELETDPRLGLARTAP